MITRLRPALILIAVVCLVLAMWRHRPQPSPQTPRGTPMQQERQTPQTPQERPAEKAAFPPGARAAFEAELAGAGKRLVPVTSAASPDTPAETVPLEREQLSAHELYLRAADAADAFLHLTASGQARDANGVVATMTNSGELLLAADGPALFLDERPVTDPHRDWQAFWVVDTADAPVPTHQRVAPFELEDHFMRQELVDERCRMGTGSVRLAQRGGGMAANRGEELDFGFERAVNPFSVFAENTGVLTYPLGPQSVASGLHAEARFYFGLPKTGNVVDTQSLPTQTDMLLALGPAGGQQVAFGWHGAARAFVLVTRSDGGAWSTLQRMTGPRPALTSWIRVAIEIRRGHVASALLDGKRVLTAALPFRVSGPLHVMSGAALVEFDDVAAWSLPAAPSPGTALYVRSRHFAGKRTKPQADKPQFREWAESASAFQRVKWYDQDSDLTLAGILTSLPLMSDFSYEAVPFSPTSGKLPKGGYRIALYAADGTQPPEPQQTPAVFSFPATWNGEQWTFERPRPGGAGEPREHSQFVLRLARRNTRLELELNGEWVAVGDDCPGPLHLGVFRTRSGERRLFSPSANHHVIRSPTLVHEFFELAPTDWSWVDGAFRMDCRWACQERWNFMACGSTSLPCMFSKRAFEGNQAHLYFASLRPAFPWDAGDPDFEYDSEQDRANGFPILRENGSWYNRRDLNFSFCTDGRNPLSGYSVLFGADNNIETRLLRRGKVVARTSRSDFRFPSGGSHMSVHWNWWKFAVRRQRGRITVHLNDEQVFDYTDPEPLEAGHVAFWSVRNGFALSRVTSMAESFGWAPQLAYVGEDCDGPWQPLLHDAVTLRAGPSPSLTQVTNNIGGGFFAVRYAPTRPVDLTETPVLELPFSQGADVSVALHLHINDRAFILRVGDTPLTGMKALLTPEFEKGECFRLPTLSEFSIRASRCLGTALPERGVVRVNLLEALSRLNRHVASASLSMLTIGNSSNTYYALAGNTVNRAGATYSVGTPVFRRE